MRLSIASILLADAITKKTQVQPRYACIRPYGKEIYQLSNRRLQVAAPLTLGTKTATHRC